MCITASPLTDEDLASYSEESDTTSTTDEADETELESKEKILRLN